MGEKEFQVSTAYSGYVFLGWAQGRFEPEQGRKMPYYNMFVLSPVSSFQSEDYKAYGLKAEKKNCLSKNPRFIQGKGRKNGKIARESRYRKE
jgi:hypothetical protein